MRLYFREEHFGAVVFHPGSGTYYELDSEDAGLLRRVLLEPGLSASPGAVRVREHVLGATGCAQEPVQLVFIQNPRAHASALSAPFKAFVNVTKRCNLFCGHCFNDSGHRSSPELELASVVRTLEQFQQHGVMKVTLAGGEPLFHPRILSILEVAGRLDIDFSLITNAIPLTPPLLDALARTENLRSITVSLDGATEPENDAVRGRGAFQRTLAGVRRLRERYDRKLALRTTVMRSNLAGLPRLPSLLKELGVQELKLNRMNPYGRATDRADLLLSDEEYRQARDQLHEQASRLGIRVEVPSFKYQVDPEGLLGLCRAGQESCEVDADGGVYPCSFSGGRFLAGNVRENDFTAILRSLQLHSINNDFCFACRGRGGTREQPVGFVPQLVRRSRPKEPDPAAPSMVAREPRNEPPYSSAKEVS